MKTENLLLLILLISLIVFGVSVYNFTSTASQVPRERTAKVKVTL